MEAQWDVSTIVYTFGYNSMCGDVLYGLVLQLLIITDTLLLIK